jgi:hypothetical protein
MTFHGLLSTKSSYISRYRRTKKGLKVPGEREDKEKVERQGNLTAKNRLLPSIYGPSQCLPGLA